MSRFVTACVASLLVVATGEVRAQEPRDTWEDPTLDAAVRGADLIVLGQCATIAPGGGTAWKVLSTLKGPVRDGRELLVAGLVAPDADGPGVEPGDKAYLVLLGDPGAAVLQVPTPTFGRFPVLTTGDFDGKPTVVAAFSDTFVRVAVPQPRFEAVVKAVIAGTAQPQLLEEARAALASEEANDVYVALEVLALFAQPEDAAALTALLADPKFAGPRRWKVRFSAVRALAKSAGHKAIPALLNLVEKDEVDAVKSAAATELARPLHTLRQSAPGEVNAAADRLAKVALTASSEPIHQAGAQDRRTNIIDSPLLATLATLAQLRAPAGIAPALRALERENQGHAIVAGLSFFQTLNDRTHAPQIANRMRPADAKDAYFNQLFARTLEKLTGQHLGNDKAPWVDWCRKQQLGAQGPATEGPPAPPATEGLPPPR